MKKIIAACLAILSVASCNKVDYNAFGGGVSTYNQALTNYYIGIADDLVCPSLAQLETALTADAVTRKYLFSTNGLDITTDGARWTATNTDRMKGVVIKKVDGETAWTVEYEGDAYMAGNTFPTTLSFKATPEDTSAGGHRNWNIENFQGQRTEEGGYAMSFQQDGKLNLKVAGTATDQWYVYGYVHVNVTKDGAAKDDLLVNHKGQLGSTSVTRITEE